MRFFNCLFFSFIFLMSSHAISQTNLKGRIFNIKDGKPVAYATVSLNKKKLNALSDIYGYFTLLLNDEKQNDSLFITSVGFTSLRIPLHDAILKNEFALYEQATNMQPIIVKSYLNAEAVGSVSDITGYFRNWNHRNSGGEIGKIFNIGKNEYKLEKVRFKLNNMCDTCKIRLRIREVVDGTPGEEIIKDSITTIVNKLSFDDKAAEFDLSNYQLILKNKVIFVGMEILNCSKKNGDVCSVCYIGTEHGNYIYRTDKFSNWSEYSDYSIYLRLFYKY